VYNDALLSAGKDKRVFGIQLVFALLNLILLLIVVPKFGLAGVLVTRLSLELCSLSLSIITYYRITSRINLSN
jgi:O-antigen/teichoic acid export membrane protein